MSIFTLLTPVTYWGVIFTAAIPAYNTWRQRAVGAEVKITAQRIMRSQIGYFLEYDKFYPPNNEVIDILNSTSPDDRNIRDIASKIHVTIQAGHLLNYSFIADNHAASKSFTLIISSEGGLEFFDGVNLVAYRVDDKETISDLPL